MIAPHEAGEIAARLARVRPPRWPEGGYMGPDLPDWIAWRDLCLTLARLVPPDLRLVFVQRCGLRARVWELRGLGVSIPRRRARGWPVAGHDDCTTPETCRVCHECQRPQPCPLHPRAALAPA